MLFLEGLARPLLVCHAISASVLVGASTHHLLWCRHYLQDSYGRINAERRFAAISTIAFVCTFILGNLLYPTYKVRVRAQYFDNPSAIAAEVKLRDAGARDIGIATPPLPTTVRSLTPVAHVFDIKEHWVALGCMASIVLFILSRRAHPREQRGVLPLYLGLAAFQCGSAWLGAVVGLVTASFRAVGGPT
ncbi:MAG TPA: hypothetical protein VIA18_22935 [Polyangia bacterium]|nr:hypothetical protein [Polyangia bacterium]